MSHKVFLEALKSETPRVLAIDDSPEVIDIIRSALKGEFQLLAVTSGKKGLEVAEGKQPDLILLDILMPEMDGFEVCRKLKANPATEDIPVIFVTGLDNHGEEVKGFEAGAVDFVTKPIEPVVLQARVRTHVELAATHCALSRANEFLANERNLIAETIHSMRNSQAFSQRFVSFISHSCGEASGDLVLSANCPHGRQHVLLGDFTGHGLSAAIGTPLVSHLFYSMSSEGYPMQDVLSTINDVLVEQLPTNIFMVAVGFAIEPQEAKVRTWNFGAPDAIHKTASEWRYFSSGELPMGIIPSSGIYKSEVVEMSPGDELYALSDGAIETVCDDGEMFGMQRLVRALEEHAGNVEKVVGELISKASQANEMDDTTLLKVQLDSASRLEGVLND